VSNPLNTFSALTERINQLTIDIRDLEEEVRTLRRALYTVALTVTGSAILFAFTVFKH
jgi:hypothetical protein